MSDRVWLVSSGSYSDYRVHCAAPSTSDLTSAEASRVLDALREDATPKSASALWQEPGDA